MAAALPLSHPPAALRRRHFAYLAFWVLSSLAMWPILARLVSLAFGHDWCSYIVLIPPAAAWLIAIRHEEIFPGARLAWRWGVGLGAAAALLLVLAARAPAAFAPTLAGLGVAAVWIAGFAACYGARATRAALFPLLFLLLVAPLPLAAVTVLIVALQHASTALCAVMFRLLGVPVFRAGFDLAVPGVTIRVAQECSSIRSSEALAITALVAGYIFLRSPWRRTVLVVVSLPLSVFKNGVRIVTLVMLALHVNPGFLHGRLHREGGFVFFLIALALLLPVLAWLARSERLRTRAARRPAPTIALAPPAAPPES